MKTPGRTKAMIAAATLSWMALVSGAQARAAAKAPDHGAAFTLSFTRIPTVPEPDAIPLYPQAPGSSAAEVWDKIFLDFRIVRNVTQPTLTPVLPPPGKRTGAAVVVVPGGGFTLLQMDMEGWAVAHWLADHGVAAFVLKYRIRPTPPDEDAFMAKLNDEIAGKGPPPPDADTPLATADAVAALRMVRANSARWGIDPAHVGMIEGAHSCRQRPHIFA